MTFSPKSVKHARMFQEIVEQVEGAILQGDLGPGDTLPPEMQLKDMFQTSRSTVREALRVLEAKGLVEIRQGVAGGAVVKSIEMDCLADSLLLFMRSNHVTFDVVSDFREAVEGAASALAAQRATQGDLDNLADILERSRAVLEADASDWDSHYKLDEQLHVAIAEIAGPLFSAVLRALHFNILDADDRFAPKDPAQLRRNYETLAHIVRAVVDRDAPAADRAAREHVRLFNDYMKDQARLLEPGGEAHA